MNDADTFSLYSLQMLLGSHFGNTHSYDLKAYSQRLKALAPMVESLRNWRGKQYAHNDRELAWQSDWLKDSFY